jgi:hypothetical protein
MIDLSPVMPQLSWVCDALIPKDTSGTMPSALEADVPTKHLPRALAVRDDMAAEFVALLAGLPAEAPDEPLCALRAHAGPSLDTIGYLIAAAYFLDPEVCRLLGYPGQEAMPLAKQEDYEEIVATVTPIIERGPIYQDVPA